MTADQTLDTVKRLEAIGRIGAAGRQLGLKSANVLRINKSLSKLSTDSLLEVARRWGQLEHCVQ